MKEAQGPATNQPRVGLEGNPKEGGRAGGSRQSERDAAGKEAMRGSSGDLEGWLALPGGALSAVP